MRRRARHSGFVLLLSLVLILLVGVALAGLARRSAATAVDTRERIAALQRRWATKSCRATLLHRAGALLEQAEEARRADGSTHAHPPVAQRRVAFRLAGRNYEIVLTDEQAKLNVDALLRDRGRAEAEATVARLARLHGGQEGLVRLRPLVAGPDAAHGAFLQPIGGYGQVFDAAPPDRLIGAGQDPGLAATVTCWGDGTINIRRAPAEVIAQACDKPLGRDMVAALLSARKEDPRQTLSQMLSKLDDFDAERKAKARNYLTDQSRCYGLWVIARRAQRSWYSLAVGVMSDESQRPDGVATVVEWREYAW